MSRRGLASVCNAICKPSGADEKGASFLFSMRRNERLYHQMYLRCKRRSWQCPSAVNVAARPHSCVQRDMQAIRCRCKRRSFIFSMRRNEGLWHDRNESMGGRSKQLFALLYPGSIGQGVDASTAAWRPSNRTLAVPHLVRIARTPDNWPFILWFGK
jgi:hypothetical protein